MASESDRQVVREMIDFAWLRTRLLISIVGAGGPVNITQVARVLGIGRGRAERLIAEARVQSRLFTGEGPM